MVIMPVIMRLEQAELNISEMNDILRKNGKYCFFRTMQSWTSHLCRVKKHNLEKLFGRK